MKLGLFFHGAVLLRATWWGTGWEGRAGTSRSGPPAAVEFAFPLLPALQHDMNNWSRKTDYQQNDHTGPWGSVKPWKYLQIRAFFYREHIAFISLSMVSLTSYNSKAMGPMDLAEVGTLHSAESHNYPFILLTSAGWVSAPPLSQDPLWPWPCSPVSLMKHFRFAHVFLNQQSPTSIYRTGVITQCCSVSLFVMCSSHYTPNWWI